MAEKTRWKKLFPPLLVAALILTAFSLRFFDPFPRLPFSLASWIRFGIIIGLIAAWGLSVDRRVIHPQNRRLFTAIAVLMMFWMIARTVKFTFPQVLPLARYCWYFYYPGMLFIPLLATEIAALLGRPEGYRLPRWTRWLYAMGGLLFLLVLTNDLHQLVFAFPEGGPFSDLNYRYGIGFIPVAVWQYGCLLATMGLLFFRSRLPGKGRRLLVPLIPAGLLVLYHIIYLLGFPWLRAVFGDMTAVECMLVICILECCLRTGLIQSNSRYAELFRLSTIRAAIVDEDYREYVTSTSYLPLDPDVMRRAEVGPVMLPGDQQLSGAPIEGGRVFWQRDLSALAETIRELARVQEELEDENAVLLENYRTERRTRRLEEQNRLYDEIHRQTAGQMRHLEELVDRFERCEDEGEKLRLLQKMQLVGVYLKRRDNLILIGKQGPVLQKRELELCFEESLQRLGSCGVESALYSSLTDDPTVETATALFDFYETVTERAFDGLQSLLVRLYRTEEDWVVSVTAATGADLSGLAGEAVSVSREEDAWTASLRVRPDRKGGARP